MRKIIYLFIISFLMQSCLDSSDDYVAKRRQEEVNFYNAAMALKIDNSNKVATNLYKISTETGTGDYFESKDVVNIRFKEYINNDNLFVNGVDAPSKENLIRDNTNGEILNISDIKGTGVVAAMYLSCINEKVGNKIKVICTSDFAYGEDGNGSNVDGYTSMYYEIEIVSIVKNETNKNELAKEIALFNTTIQKLNVPTSDKVKEGLYKSITTPAEDDAIVAAKGDKVKVHYVGYSVKENLVKDDKTFNENYIFDKNTKEQKNTPFEFTVKASQVIRAWDICLLGAKKGEKFTLYTTSEYAYGNNNIKNALIDAHNSLIFEIEVVDVIKSEQ